MKGAAAAWWALRAVSPGGDVVTLASWPESRLPAVVLGLVDPCGRTRGAWTLGDGGALVQVGPEAFAPAIDCRQHVGPTEPEGGDLSRWSAILGERGRPAKRGEVAQTGDGAAV
ncbi:MAG: hypothetical protein V1750_07170, partial [Acidobacteriota bacterium]